MGDVSFGVVALYGEARFRALDPLAEGDECVVGMVCDEEVAVVVVVVMYNCRGAV